MWLGLIKKKLLKDTIIFIFAFKIYIYIPRENKNIYLKEIENKFKEKTLYNTFIYYFKKIGLIIICLISNILINMIILKGLIILVNYFIGILLILMIHIIQKYLYL